MSISALIAKLEVAPIGSLQLDEEIATLCGHAIQVDAEGELDIVYDPPYQSGMKRCKPIRYTASVDAALSLIPEGRLWWLGQLADRSGFAAHLDNNKRSVKAATAPLALCVAALHARVEAETAP